MVGRGGDDPTPGKNLCSENLRDASDGTDKQTTTWLQGNGTDFWYMECTRKPMMKWKAQQLLGIRGRRSKAANRDEWRRLTREAKVWKGL